VYRRAAEGRDGAASLELFATTYGLRRLLDGATGLAGVAGRLLMSPRLEGVHAQVAAEEEGARISTRVLRAPGAAPAAFVPTLADRVPRDAAGFLALPGADAMTAIAERAGAAALLALIEDALPSAAGVELADVLAPLGDEAQLTVQAGEAAPIFTIASRTRDAASTRESLARLQGPVSGRLGGGPFQQRELRGGTDAFTLSATPELEPSYAIAKDAVVLSTAGSGLEQIRPARSPASGAPVLEDLLPEEGEKVEALGFLDPRQLLALGERTGLAALSSPAARDDLGRIRSAGLVVKEDANQPTDTTAELFLQIP
jgi:hypothetical protein